MSKPLASIDRPLELRLRPDLQAAPVEMSGRATWIVKDPVTLEHFQFSPAEHALMEQLRRPVSIGKLQRAFEREFAPERIGPQAVWDFLSRLHEAGLLVSDAAGQGQELLARMRRERTQRWTMAWTRLLAIRFRGIDPDALLETIQDRCGWLFSRAALVPAMAAVLYALWLVVGHFDEFRSRLPELSALVDARNLPWLLVAIGGVKVLHELGHALACKHFGGEVRELGFMLLVFAPCLYCDVSDAWRLPSKWRRIAVSSAGIVVELVLAAVATIAWWHAQPGIVQLVALNIMLVATVGTLLVNGNPLLRYDGYYILSDLVETPNLWQRSRDVLGSLWAGWFTTRPPAADDPLVPARHRRWLALYAAASKVYLCLLLVAIVWGLVELLHPHRLETLAYAVGLAVFGSTLVGPIRNLVRTARNPMRREEQRTGRMAAAATLVLVLAVAVLAMPVNYYVKAPLVLMPADAVRVYATISGSLAESRPAGTAVKRGDTIGRLENADIELELARLEGERQVRQMRLEHARRLRGLDRDANDELPAVEAALADVERRLAEHRREAARLTLVAPADGVLIAAPRRMAVGGAHPTMRLANWAGSLLDSSNTGALVEAGTLVALVGDPKRLDAVLLVDDTDVKRLAPGQRAELRIDQLPGQVIEGEVLDVSRHDVREMDDGMAGRAELAGLFARLVPPGTQGALYEARVRFEGLPQVLVIGGRGEAKVTAERITLARRVVRYIAQTFRLPM